MDFYSGLDLWRVMLCTVDVEWHGGDRLYVGIL